MDNKKLLNDGIVDQYVRGQLSEQETVGFETHFLDQTEIIEEIEISQSFRMAVQRSNHHAEITESPPWWQRFFSLQGSSGWVTAFATMAFVVVAQSVYFGNQIEQLSAPQANTPVLILSQTRGGPPTGIMHLNDNIRWFALELELEWPEADSYSLTINDDQSGQPVARVDDLTVSSNDTLLVSLPAQSFPQGEYSLAVRDGRAEVARFRLRVVRSAAK